MSSVIDRLAVAINAHDLDAAAGLFHEDYRSEQPAHPGRAFTGRAQMRANWAAIFAGIPDFHAEIGRSVRDGETTWTEWRWSGTRRDGQAFGMRGVTLFEISGDQIVAGRLRAPATAGAAVGRIASWPTTDRVAERRLIRPHLPRGGLLGYSTVASNSGYITPFYPTSPARPGGVRQAGPAEYRGAINCNV